MQPLPIATSLRTCRCGATFACGAASGSCWCFAMPNVINVPRDGVEKADCLCPDCLRRAIDARAGEQQVERKTPNDQ